MFDVGDELSNLQALCPTRHAQKSIEEVTMVFDLLRDARRQETNTSGDEIEDDDSVFHLVRACDAQTSHTIMTQIKYKVRCQGYSSNSDEWLSLSRLKRCKSLIMQLEWRLNSAQHTSTSRIHDLLHIMKTMAAKVRWLKCDLLS